MRVKVSELPDEGLDLDERAFAVTPFADPVWQLERLRLTVRRADEATVLVEGDFTARVPLVCARCLNEIIAAPVVAIDARFEPRPAAGADQELADDDFEVEFYVEDALDLAALLDSEATLALPMKPLCRVDCRGLCPTCGASRNGPACPCPPPPADPRLAPLAKLSGRLPV